MDVKSFAVVGLTFHLVLLGCVREAPDADGGAPPLEQVSATTPSSLSTRGEQTAAAYGQLALSFEANLGQADPRVDFLSRGPGYTLFLTAQDAVLALGTLELKAGNLDTLEGTSSLADTRGNTSNAVFRMHLVGANQPAAVGLEELPGKVHYFIGNDPTRWRTDISTYSSVRYGEVYPGIDLIYYGRSRQLEYDFVVAPGVDPTTIRLAFEGIEQIDVSRGGDLVFETAGAEIRMLRPVIYQWVDGGRREIPGEYHRLGRNEVRFQIGTYDAGKPLVIDPVLQYSSYLGGRGLDFGFGIAVDDSGNAYLTGVTDSNNFPTANPLQPGFDGLSDAFVTKLNADGSAIVYSTYLGGSGSEIGFGIVVDDSGNAYVTGITDSNNFPTLSALQPSFGGGPSDAFVTKLNPDGSALVYSTYLGGNRTEIGFGVAADDSGNAYLSGTTESNNFPTAGPIQPTFGGASDAYVAKLDATGSALVYSSYLGGSGLDDGMGIALDGSGNAYVAGGTESNNFPTANPLQPAPGGGSDAFVAKLKVDGSALVYSTYLGGSGSDKGVRIAVDDSDNAYVVGDTGSSNFPTVNPLQPSFGGNSDVFVARLNATGSALVYSTYLGGIGLEGSGGIALDGSGNAYVTGGTGSSNFPTADPVQAVFGGGTDVFVAKLDVTGSALVYSTFLGASGSSGIGISVDGSGSAYVTGGTNTNDFPLANPVQPIFGGGASDALVFKIATEAAAGEQTLTVPDLGGVSIATGGGSESIVVGHARIEPESGATTPASIAIFEFRQNNVLVSEAGVPASRAVQGGRIFAEVDGPLNTGLAIANSNDAAASVSFFFTDSGGNNSGNGDLILPANGQIAKFLNEDPFNSAVPFTGTFTFTSSIPVSVVALRGLTNKRSEFLVTTLPVAALSPTTEDTIFFPHFADGSGWTTEVILVNPTDTEISGTVRFMGPGSGTTAAQPLTLVLKDGQIGSDFSYSIPPRSSRRMRTSNPGSTVQVGSVRVIRDSASSSPSGLGVFSFASEGITVSEAGVPVLAGGSAFRMYAEVSGTIRSGFAIANTSTTVTTAMFELTDLDGDSTGLTASLTIPPSGHAAKFLDEIFPSLTTPFQGVLRITSTTTIAVVGLRGRDNERGDFLITTSPPTNEADPVSGQASFFPHLVDGGGYTTQFILYSGSAGQSTSGVLAFFSQSGLPLNLVLR